MYTGDIPPAGKFFERSAAYAVSVSTTMSGLVPKRGTPAAGKTIFSSGTNVIQSELAFP